ncbi:hypothetical protein PSHT_13893 [Puccinia striiformis]|uniref:Uncharacterized protein n=1 Tax=Puccinia striiformis TaxID=27350 RepID=A0A2S4UN25_9BASI|nr:hypothetical protein PSHT_13893 [Puccinia striiformis]
MSNIQLISDAIKNNTNRADSNVDDDQTPNPSPSIPTSQQGPTETQGEIPSSQGAPATKTTTRVKPKTRASAKQQGKGANPSGALEPDLTVPSTAKEDAATLGTEAQGEGNEQQGEKGPDETDDDLPEITMIIDKTHDNKVERARRAQIALDKAVKADDEGNEERAEIFYGIYHSLLPEKKTAKNPVPAIATTNSPQQPIVIGNSSFSSTTPQKRSHKDGVTTEVRNLKFRWGVSNNHSNGGFTPYFHKNILELKGYIPLTIFNKEWQARALAWHAENRSKVSDEEKGLKYWGLKVPSEHAMSFSDWTLNYTVFYETMLYSYKFDTLAEWILLHKANCDKILRKDGFMTALRYDIKVRTNAWQFKPTVDGEEFVSDFSKLKTETYEEAYGEARNNDELQYKTTNPYEIGGPREKWDAPTGTRPAKPIQNIPDIKAPRQPATSGSLTLLPSGTNTTLPTKPGQFRGPRTGSGYQGNNYNPNYARGNNRQGGRNRDQ